MLSAKRLKGLTAIVGLTVLAFSFPARAAVTYQLLTENLAADAGQQIGVVSYASLPDVFAGSFTSAAFTPLSLVAGYSIAGLTHDAAGYRVVTQNDNAPAGQQIGVVTYATLPDLLNGNFASAGFTQLSPAAGYQVAGVAWDGTAYQVLTEDLNAPTGEQVGVVTYDTFTDLMSGTFSSGGFTQLSLAAGYQIGGFTWDGTGYQILTEDLNAPAGEQVGVVSYNSLTDLKNGDFSAGGFTQISLAPGYKIAGFAATITDAGNGGGVGGVPEPATWALMLLGFGSLGASLRSHRRAVFMG